MNSYTLNTKCLESKSPNHTFLHLFLIFLVLFLAVQSTTPSFAIDEASNRTLPILVNKTKPKGFTINNFSPYLTNDVLATLSISTKMKNITGLTISVLAPTNTKSELFSFADKPQKTKPSSKTTIPIEDIEQTPNLNDESFSDLNVSFGINNNDPLIKHSITLNKTAVYPIAVEALDANSKVLDTQYVFSTYFRDISSLDQAYSQKLNIAPIIKYAPSDYDLSKSFNGSRLTKQGKELQDKFNSEQNEISAILQIATPKSLILNGRTLEDFSLINLLNKPGENNGFVPNVAPTGTQYIADTYSPMNIVKFSKIKSKNVFADSLTKSRSVLLNNDISAPSRTLVTKSVSSNTQEDISKSGIDNIVVDQKTFSTKIKSKNRPVKITKNNSTLNVATYQTDFMSHININENFKSQSNYLNAYSSVVALEAPSNERAIALLLDTSKIDLNAIEIFLNSIAQNPIVKPTTLDSMFSTITPDTSNSKNIEKSDFGYTSKDSLSQDTFEKLTEYYNINKSLFNAVSIDNKISESLYSNAVSTDVTQSQTKDLLSKLVSIAQSPRSFISLPTKRTITLTSNESSIPVTIKNTSGAPITVAITIKSDKLIFTDSDSIKVTLESLNTTLNFPIKVRTSGTFPIDIKMTSVDNKVLIASQKVTIRSNTFSGLGIGIMVGSCIFLLVWWISHSKKNRKKPKVKVLEFKEKDPA